MPRPKRASSAFVLGELIVSMLALGIVGGALLTAWLMFARSTLPAVVAVGGERLAVAPSFTPFPSAVRLHSLLAGHLAKATAVFVFGGAHVGIDPASSVCAQGPLALEALPPVRFTSGLAPGAASLYGKYTAELGGLREGASPADFSALVIGVRSGELVPLCLVQHDRVECDVSDSFGPRRYARLRVRLWDADGRAEAYAFAEPAERRGGFVGATHTWFRYREGDPESVEGPSFVAFPDPWLWAGSRGEAGEAPAFSRFLYLMSPGP